MSVYLLVSYPAMLLTVMMLSGLPTKPSFSKAAPSSLNAGSERCLSKSAWAVYLRHSQYVVIV